MKTKFIPIDYDYFDFNERNYIKIIGRDSKGKRLCVIDTCPIYLWGILEEDLSEEKIKKIIEKIKKIKIKTAGRTTEIEKIEVHKKQFLEKPVKALKIFATNYKDLHDIADKLALKGIEKRRGYDLGFVTHYIIEKKFKPLQAYDIEGPALNGSKEFGGIADSIDADIVIKLKKHKESSLDFKPKSLAYDIETDEFKVGKGEILMVSLVGKGFEKVITWKKPDSKKPKYVEYVKDEKALIKTFIKEVKNYSPDFLIGYFSDAFDMPYLRERAKKNNLKLSLGLDNSQPRFFRGAIPTAKVSGIVHVDLLKFIQTAYAQYMKSETLSLNEVSKEFLGDEKKNFKLKHSSKIEDSNWENYFAYNLQDSKLTLGLFEKFWPDMQEFTKVTQEPVFDISRAGLSKIVESYILHNLEKYNEIPEKRPGHEEIAKRRARMPSIGAFVYEPQPGLYENIVFFDFTSMHTSIIVSFNLSKGTLLDKKGKNSHETPEFLYQGKKTKFYFSNKPGFFPSLAKEIFEKRKNFKSEYKKDPSPITKARSNAFKLLSASVHGYVAFFGARYFSAEASNSILAFVRKINQDVIEKTKQEGLEVVYADTDSIAFLRKRKSKKETQEYLRKLNSQLPGIMELELEGFFKRGLWVTKRTGKIGAKKKYALIDEKGKLKIRGFETVRRDWCPLAREVQNHIIELVLEDGNENRAMFYLKDIIKKLKERKVDLEKLMIRTQLKKPLSEYKALSPHVVAAQKMKKLKMPIDPGSLIEFYIAESHEGKKLVRERVKLPGEEGEYDINYYLKHQILPAVENILQVFKINIEETIEGKRQTKLGDF